jgi:hypothetical protein
MKQKVRKRATSAIPIIAYQKEDIEPLVKELMELSKLLTGITNQSLETFSE